MNREFGRDTLKVQLINSILPREYPHFNSFCTHPYVGRVFVHVFVCVCARHRPPRGGGEWPILGSVASGPLGVSSFPGPGCKNNQRGERTPPSLGARSLAFSVVRGTRGGGCRIGPSPAEVDEEAGGRVPTSTREMRVTPQTASAVTAKKGVHFSLSL